MYNVGYQKAQRIKRLRRKNEKVLAEIEAGRLDKHACQLPLTEVRGLATSLG